jgi:hypothetical protein
MGQPRSRRAGWENSGRSAGRLLLTFMSVGFALAATACWYTIPELEGAGSGGASGATGGAGSGASGGSCIDVIDVMPRAVASNAGAPRIAATPSGFAVVWQKTSDIFYQAIDADGGPVGTILSWPADFVANSLSVSASGDTVAVVYESGVAVELRRGSLATLEETIILFANTGGAHPLVTSGESEMSDNGFLITLHDTNFKSAWLSHSAAAATTLTADIADVYCCATREWFVVPHTGGFGAVYKTPPGEILMTRLSGLGEKVAAAVATPFVLDRPHYGAPLRDNMVFGNFAGELSELGQDGSVIRALEVPIVPFGACTVGSTGELLRWAAVNEDGDIEWRSVDATGLGPVLAVLPVPNFASSVQVAWDGTGFGAVWVDSELTIGFAYIIPCAS